MSLSEDDLLQILDLFTGSDWDDLSLSSGDVRLTVSKRPAGAAVAPEPAAAPTASPTATAAAQVAPPPVQAAAGAVSPPCGEDIPAGFVAVRSPTMGTFFVAPKPGAPPFVTEGDRVAAGATLGIVEVMKLMNPVTADVSGHVRKVCVANNEVVDADQVLFWIEPAEGTTP